MVEQRAVAGTAAPAELAHGLTVGVAWNGAGAIGPCFEAGLAVPYVAEILVSPMDAAAAEAARTAAAGQARIRVLPPGDSGIYSAWNKLVAACRTSHIVFHGIDDLIVHHPAIEAALAHAGRTDMLVCSIQFATADGRPTSIYHHRETRPPALSLGRHANTANPEVIWPVRLIRELGGLDESFRIAGDAELYFRLRPHARRVDVDAVLLTMRDGGISTRARHARTVWLENRRIAQAAQQQVPWSNLLLSGLFLNGRYLIYRLAGEDVANRLTDALRALAGRPRRFSVSPD